MVKVKYVPNVLSNEGRIEKGYPNIGSRPVGDFVRKFADDTGASLKDTRAIVRGKVVPLEAEVYSTEEIIIAGNVGGPAVAFIAAAVTWVGGHIAMAASFALTAYSVYQAVTAAKPKLPDFGTLATDGSLDQSSPTYGWDGIQSTQEVGIPIRILYGEHRIGGNIINQYIRTDGDKQYLNVLFGLCEGEIESLSSLQINNNPAANYSGITETQRLGTNSQTVIPNFEDQHSLQSMNVHLIMSSAQVYTTVATDVEAFEVHLSIPTGLFQVNSDGGVQAWEITYTVEYRVSGGGAYTSLGTQTINDKSKAALKRIFRKDGLSPAQYDIRITRTSDDPSLTPQKEGELYLTGVDEITTEDLAYPNLALSGIEALATDQLSGGTPNFTWLAKGLKIHVPDVRYGGVAIAWDLYYWDGVSAFKRLSDNAACTWDGSTYITAYSANPVWCLRDLLTNTRYGLGEYIDTTEIDDDAFLEMAKYCDERVSDGSGGYEKRFRLDVAIDSLSGAMDIISQLTATFRAFAFYQSGTIKLKIDKADSIVQVFGMGNIVKSSFTQNWKSKKEMPNVIEVAFNDADKNYEQEIAAVIDEAALTAGEPLRKKQIRIYCTRLSQALREGRFALNVGKYVNRVVTLRASVEAVACQAGDLIGISHDVPAIGESGRVASGSTTTVIKLDREVNLLALKTYQITIRFADDTIETRTISTTFGAYTQVTVSSAFSQTPAAYDVYAVGEVAINTKPFRVVGVRRENTNEVELTALEYNEDLFDTDSIVLPETNYSTLSFEVPLVTDLELTERDVRLSDGTVQIYIDVAFQKPDLGTYLFNGYKKARVYLSDDDGASWVFKAEVTDRGAEINVGLLRDITYKIAVTSVSATGIETALGLSPQDEITVQGKLLPPSDLTTFLINQSRDRLLFGWTPIPDADLFGYEIRRGAAWDTADVVATDLKGNTFVTYDVRIETAVSYWIKAIDTSGNYSDAALEAVLTVDAIPFKNIIIEYEEETAWSGTKVDTSVDTGKLVLDTGELTGTYETAVRDIGFVAAFKIGIEGAAVVAGDRAFDADTTSEFDDDEAARFSGDEIAGALSYEIKTSEDNVTWTSYQAWQPGDYYCRYFQLKMTVTRSAVDVDLEVDYLHYSADLPDVDDFGSDTISVAADGVTVLYGKTFYQEPVVAVSILSGTGVYWRVSNKDEISFDVHLYNAAGTAVTGDFEYHAHGV